MGFANTLKFAGLTAAVRHYGVELMDAIEPFLRALRQSRAIGRRIAEPSLGRRAVICCCWTGA